MLAGGQLYDVLCAVVPLYVALFLGYGSLKWWGVVTPEQSAGLGRVNAIIAMPPLVFEIIAFNNPYTMNSRLIAAYSLANAVVLVALLAWARCAKRGNLDWVITLFQLSVMPNTIIVGIPVLTPLYSITGAGIAAVFIGQVLWLFPVLFLYELRAAKQNLGIQPLGLPHGAQVQAHGTPALMTEAECDGSCRVNIEEQQQKDGELQIVPHGNPPGVDEGAENASGDVNPVVVPASSKEMAFRVATKMAKLPLTYATGLGIVYSLIAGRWGFGPPQILKNSLDIIGRISLGLTMYNIGLFMAGQNKLVTLWWDACYGAFCRFLVGPCTMGFASLLLGQRGDILRFAILQAALPQAVISFVFAKDYDLHTSVFTTAVSLQTIVFMPIVLAYYLLLEL